MNDRFALQLASEDPEVARVLGQVPLRHTPPLPTDWLRCEMLERFCLLRELAIRPGTKALEVGSGPHAIATVPLAQRVGPQGWVVAVERARWTYFREIVHAAGVAARVSPVQGDARHLPLKTSAVDLAICVHALRSLGDDEALGQVFSEMLRVAKTLVVAESLPEARSEAQAAFLAMYSLRAEVLEATTGRIDDRPYLPLPRLIELVEASGGRVSTSQVVAIDLPDALAHFPRSWVEKIGDPALRERLTARWQHASDLIRLHGADHPPVALVVATR